jgi:hypothetical protein
MTSGCSIEEQMAGPAIGRWVFLFSIFFSKMGIRILILFDVDPDPTLHPDADPDRDSSFQINAQTLEKVLK